MQLHLIARATLFALLVGAVGVIGDARAQSSQSRDFGSFFSDVCLGMGSPASGSDLELRCEDSGGALSAESSISLDPNQAASNIQSRMENVRELQQSVRGRLETRRDAVGFARARGGRAPSLASASGAPLAALGLEGVSAMAGDEGSFLDRVGLLLGGRGITYDRDNSSNERGYDGYFAGPQLGADYRVSDALVVGGFFNYDYLNESFDRQASSATFLAFPNDGKRRGNNYFFTAFGSYNITEELYADVSVGGGFSDISFRRNVVFQPSGGGIPSQVPVNTQADVTGNQFTAEGGVGYGMYYGGFLIDPYARARYIRSHTDSYTEQGGGGNGLSMRFGDKTQPSLVTVLGLRTSYSWSTDFGVVVPVLRFEWEHEFENDRISTTSSFPQDLASTPFIFAGDDPDRNYFNLGGGFAVVLPGGLMPYFDFDARLGYRNLTLYRFAGGLRIEL
jgi:outer membrane lipase/esterase